MASFNLGDTVRLKSGGPLMTIANTALRDSVICLWFDGTERKEGRFPPEALEAVDKDASGMTVKFVRPSNRI